MRRRIFAKFGVGGVLFLWGVFLSSAKQFGSCHYTYTPKTVISNLLTNPFNHLFQPGPFAGIYGLSTASNVVRRLSSVGHRKRYRQRNFTTHRLQDPPRFDFDLLAETLLNFGQPRPYVTATGRRYLSPYNTGNFSVQSTTRKRLRSWESASKQWQERAQKFGLRVYKKETGGGGNCLFYSISGGLQDLFYRYGVYAEGSMEVLRELAAASFIGPALLTGERPEQNVVEDFIKKLGVLAALEEANDWLDHWSPTTILREGQYRTSQGRIIDTSRIQGKAQAMFEELSDTSGVHWGSDFDVGALEEALNIGIVILAHNSGKIYPIAGKPYRGRPYYVLLYYHDQAHFQQAGVGSSPMSVQSGFSQDDLPDFLKEVIEEDTKQIF